MTFEDALEELGLATPPDALTARRAYLRAVKKHPPEHDREGFRRVREAYELLTAKLSLRLGDAEAAVESSRAEREVSVEEDIERLWDQHEYGSEAAVQASRALVAEHPDLASPRWLLIAQLEGSDREAEAKEALFEAYQAGFEEFRTVALARFGEDLGAAEVRAAAASEDVEERIAAADAFLLRHQPVHAGRLYVRLLEAARNGEGPPPDLDNAVMALAAMMARGKTKTKSSLESQLRAVLVDPAFREDDGFNPVRWLLLSELLRLEGRLDEELYRAIAGALSGPEIDPEYPEISLFRGTRPRRAEALRRLLQREAPNLHRLFGDKLRSPYRVHPWKVLSMVASAWAAIVLIIGLSGEIIAQPPPLPKTAPTTLLELVASGGPLTRGLALELESALARHDCPRARRALSELVRSRPMHAVVALGQARAELRARCGPDGSRSKTGTR